VDALAVHRGRCSPVPGALCLRCTRAPMVCRTFMHEEVVTVGDSCCRPVHEPEGAHCFLVHSLLALPSPVWKVNHSDRLQADHAVATQGHHRS